METKAIPLAEKAARPLIPPPRAPATVPPRAAATTTKASPSPSGERSFGIRSGRAKEGERIVIYGTGGVGKTTLAGSAPNPVFFDFDSGVRNASARVFEGVATWSDMRDALHGKDIESFQSIVIDSGTKAQELALAHTLATVKHEKGHFCTSIEGYGFGKGFQHVYDTFLQLLGDLDNHARAGRNVILVCHSVVELAPNPEGEDYRRYEPDLQQPPKNGRLRDRVKNWCDHLLFLNYDVIVEHGKGKGSGTRTIYSQEIPTFWAKSRTLRDPIPYPEGSTDLWAALFQGVQQ